MSSLVLSTARGSMCALGPFSQDALQPSSHTHCRTANGDHDTPPCDPVCIQVEDIEFATIHVWPDNWNVADT